MALGGAVAAVLGILSTALLVVVGAAYFSGNELLAWFLIGTMLSIVAFNVYQYVKHL